MKAVISSTYDDPYFFFIPIATWCWNKLGIDVICFLPFLNTIAESHKIDLITDLKIANKIRLNYQGFRAPDDKKATYAQCARLYASACEDLQEDEVLITSDVDMAVFKPPTNGDPWFVSLGADLVEPSQLPMCYASASVRNWRQAFTKGRSYQQCLDDLLGHIECEHFRGNHWCKDQETLCQGILAFDGPSFTVDRARPGTKFAADRLDRDDRFLLERLNKDVIDYHMPRPGFQTDAFNQIYTVLEYMYPGENLQWLVDYKNAYLNLL